MSAPMREQVSDARARHQMLATILRASIAAQVRALRRSQDCTQDQLAKGIGTSQSAIARLEDPYSEFPTLETLHRVAEFFDVGLLTRFSSWSEFLQTYCNGAVPVPVSYAQDDALFPQVESPPWPTDWAPDSAADLGTVEVGEHSATHIRPQTSTNP